MCYTTRTYIMSGKRKNRQYHSSNNILYSCKYHVIFCPKYRRKVLMGDIEKRFKAIADEVAQERNFIIESIEVMPDHVHMLIDCDPQLGIHKAIKLIKGRSSRYLRQEFPALKSRLPTLWTNSYFVVSVGGAPLSIVKQYIENQKQSEKR